MGAASSGLPAAKAARRRVPVHLHAGWEAPADRPDPIGLLERQLRDQGELDDSGLRTMEGEIMSALEAAVAFAEASPFPLPEQATDDVFAA